MRRLNLGGRVKYDVVREMRALRRWADDLTFPPDEGFGYSNFKLPMPQALVSPPKARRPVQAACAQVLIDAAARLAGEKPRGLEQARVFAIINYPDMFQSEVCVFFDPDYLAGFCVRASDEQRWTPKSDDSLVGRLGLSLPGGFEARGFDTVYRDDTFDPPYVEEGETWMIGERI